MLGRGNSFMPEAALRDLSSGGIPMAKFRVWVSTDKVGSKCEDTIEIDDEDLATMSENDIDNQMFDHVLQMISWDYRPAD
jgi:hypothetical protein